MPGLVLALVWGDAEALLVDGSEHRIAFVERWINRLELRSRVQAVQGRAEELARDPAWRQTFDLVVARSFGRPAVTAECATGFLALDGRVAVSEPPEEHAGRWSEAGLEQLGLRFDGSTDGIARLRQVAACESKWPRRVGVPSKRPLW